MSRQIDFTQPLTEDEIAYVNDRPWLLQDARMRGLDIISDNEFVVDDASDASDDSDDDADDADNEEEDDDEEEEDEDLPPYEEWSYADLKAEAERRELPKSGSKEQLIERLTESDSDAE